MFAERRSVDSPPLLSSIKMKIALTSDSQLPVTDKEVEAGVQWVIKMYQQADSKDVGVVREYFAEDAKVHFGNAPPITGTAAIEGLFAWEYSAVESLDHVIRDIRVLHDKTIVTLEAIYTFKGGVEKTTKCLAVWHKTPQTERASGTDLYGDFTDVFKQLIAAGGPPPVWT